MAHLEPDERFINALMGEDDLGSVIRAHIHIESHVNALLDVLVPHPELLPHLRYEQRVRLACALGLHDRWFDHLKRLGDLRNRFGHNLDTVLTGGMVAELEDAIPEQDRNGFLRGVNAAFPSIRTFEELRSYPARTRFIFAGVSMDKLLAMAIEEFRGKGHHA